MISAFLDFMESFGVPVAYGRRPELNVKLKNIREGEIVILVEEPSDMTIAKKALGLEPILPFSVSVVSPVPLERDSVKNVELLDETLSWVTNIVEGIYASKRFRVSGDLPTRKVQEREFDLNCIGWRFTARLVYIKREKCTK